MRYEAVPLQMCKNMLLSLTTSLNKVLSVKVHLLKQQKNRWPRQHQQQKFGQQNENKKKNKMTINLRKSR